jgi:hypothetical protein
MQIYKRRMVARPKSRKSSLFDDRGGFWFDLPELRPRPKARGWKIAAVVVFLGLSALCVLVVVAY